VISAKEAKLIAKALKYDIKAPYVNAYVSTLGGSHRSSVLFTISLDPKSEWTNDILENSRYAKFHLQYDGTIEMHSGGRGFKKLRKTKTKSYEHLLEKIRSLW
jgi:hypothetical protein